MQPPHHALYWRYGAQSSIRQDNWKLLNDGKQAPQLYDLSADISENHNLAEKEPARVDEMSLALTRWISELHAPL